MIAKGEEVKICILRI